MIRSLTVIGHGTNLIEHHINHYSKYVDEICYIVYNTENSPRLNEEVQEIIKDYKNVKVVRVHQDRVFDWERVTMLYNYVTNKEPNDWWVVADVDEFHFSGYGTKAVVKELDQNQY